MVIDLADAHLAYFSQVDTHHMSIVAVVSITILIGLSVHFLITSCAAQDTLGLVAARAGCGAGGVARRHLCMRGYEVEILKT